MGETGGLRGAETGRTGSRPAGDRCRARALNEALAKAGSSPAEGVGGGREHKEVWAGDYTHGVSEIEAVQEVSAVPVLAPEPIARGGLIRSVAPAKQAIVAAGGFVAGAAIVGLMGHRRARAARPLAGRGARRRDRAGELVRIVGTRSLLVDIHLLGGPDR